MSTVRIRNVGSFGREIRPDLDGVTLAVVEVGEVVEVSARLAGRKPDPDVDGDHGEGLLAQVGVWDLEDVPWTDPVPEYSEGQVVYATPTVDAPGVPVPADVEAVVIDVEHEVPTHATATPEELPAVPSSDTAKEV